MEGGHSIVFLKGEEVWKQIENKSEIEVLTKIPAGLDTLKFLRVENGYIITSYVPGSKINEQIIRSYNWEQWKKILLRLARCLEFLHLHNIVHGDLSPTNLILNTDPEPHFGCGYWIDDGNYDPTVDPDDFESLIQLMLGIVMVLFADAPFDYYTYKQVELGILRTFNN